MNMYAKALNLPDFFLFDGSTESTGGGSLQGSASDCTMLALLAAKSRAVEILQGDDRNPLHESSYLPQMVAYTSEEAHSSVQKAAKITMIRLRILPTDEHGSLRGDVLANAVKHDVEVEKFIPIFVSATCGTTGTCAFDPIHELGRVIINYPTIWLHVDGAYAGNSLILPEMRDIARGFEYIHSFNTNPNKFLLTPFDASCLWVRNMSQLKRSMFVDPPYLEKAENEGEDLRHYSVSFSRRFRSLKLWVVLRNYGLDGLRNFMRTTINCAQHLVSLIKSDNRFALENEPRLGLVCFRIFVPHLQSGLLDLINMEFLHRMNESGRIFMVPATFKSKYIIRFCITKEHITNEDIGEFLHISKSILLIFLIGLFFIYKKKQLPDGSWKIIQEFAAETLLAF